MRRRRSDRSFLILLIAGGVFCGAVVFGAVWYWPVPDLAHSAGLSEDADRHLAAIDRQRKMRLDTIGVIVSAFTGIGLVFTLLFTYRNVQLADRSARQAARIARANMRVQSEAQAAASFLKAFELLGDASPAVRAAATYALGAAGRVSREYHWAVVLIVAGLLRKGGLTPAERQAAIDVVRSRNAAWDSTTEPIDLRHADLRRANLDGIVLRGALIDYGQLSGASLEGADLSGAHLASADLVQARLGAARLRDSYLAGANLTMAQTAGADLDGANVENAVLDRIVGPVRNLDRVVGTPAKVNVLVPPGTPPDGASAWFRRRARRARQDGL